MVEGMVALHNEVISPEDDVWHIGDFSLSPGTVPLVLPRLNGRHRLVAGNHDAVHPMRKGNESYRSMYRDAGFIDVVTEHLMEIEGVGSVKLSHMPYTGDTHDGEKYASWRPKWSGEDFLIHGHVHGRWQKLGKMINVAADAWGCAPVSIDQIKSVVQSNESEVLYRP